MPRLSSTVPPDGRVAAQLDNQLALDIERIHHPGEAMARTLNRILRAGVNAIRSEEGRE